MASPEEIAKEMSICLEERVTPYYLIDYPEQIKRKGIILTDLLKSFSEKLRQDVKAKREESFPAWFNPEAETPCEMAYVIESDPEFREGYRNKDEFTIGRRYEDNQICVGFNKGNMSKGIMFVDYPDKIKVVSEEAV